MSIPPLPRLIALCGRPTSGKSTAAEILHKEIGYEILDDGLPLREIGMNYFGLTERDVFTQEGKIRPIEINGRETSVRQLLGDIGAALEEKLGANTVPFMSLSKMYPHQRYVMGSVRRDQGHFWKKRGALVIEIERPGVAPSPFEFDHYSKSAVDVTVRNEFDPEDPKGSRHRLTNDLLRALGRIS